MAGGTQIFVRNREGKVFGPIEPSTVELLIEGGVLQGLLQVSTDGESYALPYRFPHLRDFFPRHLWGDDSRPEVTLDAEGVGRTAPAPPEHELTAALFGSEDDGGADEPIALQPEATPGAAAQVPAAATRGPPVLTAAPAGPPPAVVTGAAPPTLGGAPRASGPAAPARPPGKTPTGSVPAPPVLTPEDLAAPAAGRAPARSAAPGRTSPGASPVITAPVLEPAPPAPARGGPPVLTAAPVEPVDQASPRPAGPFQPEDVWAEAVPFELAPPSSPKPPSRPSAPITSTFGLLRADLSETNALRIYVQGARAGATGLFFFDLEDRTATIYMRRGNPESAESTHASDAIGPFLVAQRLATAEQVARAEKEALKYGNDVLAALFTLGAVNPGLVFPALAQRAADILLHAYLAPRGSFRFEALELPPSKVVPLGNRWGLLAEVVRRVPLPELKARLLDVRERPVVRRGAGDALPDLRLTAQETRAVSYFDGTRSLAHLAQSNAGEMDTILRVALLLRELEAISFPDVQLRGPPPAPPPRPEAVTIPSPPPAPRPTPPPAAAPQPPPPRPVPAAAAAPPRKPTGSTPVTPRAPLTPALTPSGLASLPQADPPRISPVAPPPAARKPTQTLAAELRELQARAEKLRKENHFKVLGIPESADAAMVKAAYFKLAKQYHPDTVPPDAPAELARAKAEIFAAIGEANRVLADDASRARYRETLAEGGPADVDVQSVLQAEETFNRGTSLVRARRFAEAVKTFDDAIAANPKEGEFYAWRGYARFFTLQDKKVAMVEALRDLNQSLRLNDRCAPAHYFIGQVYKLTGDAVTALKHFKRCVVLDPQHTNAQREIRIAGSQK